MKNNINQIKEIIVFTNGDSSKISTWSNLPFFFTKTLIAKGITVDRINLKPCLLLKIIHDKIFYIFFKLINKYTTYAYFRSFMHFVHMRHRIKNAIKQYPKADANIFLTFSFSSAGLTEKPTIQFCDWTYDYYFKYFENRKPDFFEKRCIEREDSQIRGSDLIFTIFPLVAEHMRNRYNDKNIFYIEGHVINSLCEAKDPEIIKKKKASKKLLFVGDKKYLAGAQCLIEAFDLLKKEYPGLSLHIIGMSEKDFKYLPNGVNCYGYLDKGKDSDRELYYSLFQSARVLINTTPKWSGFSSTIEAMYFYTPVIVIPYGDFVETFGKDIKFGYYCENNVSDLLAMRIREILNSESYGSLCVNAHNSVGEYTWSACIDKILQRINN